MLATVSKVLGAAQGERRIAANQDARPNDRGAQEAPAKGTVLLVDDNEQARFVLRKRLQFARYAVLDAPDAETALRLFREQPADLAIIDIILPGMSGAEIIAALRSEAPSLGIIAISGAPEQLAALEGQLGRWGGSRTLRKPFSTPQLLEAMDAVRPGPQPQRRLGARLKGLIGFLRGKRRREEGVR